jgi:hypothetical protein
MKRLFFAFITISSVFSAYAQDAIEQRFDVAMRQTKLALQIKSIRHELEMLKNELQTQKDALSARAQAFIKALIANPDVEGYLNRSPETVSFSDLHVPELVNKKEQKLYEFFSTCAAYRGLIKDGSFFRRYSGSVNGVQQYTKARLQEWHTLGLKTAKNKIVFEINGGSPQTLRQKIADTQLNIKQVEWHVTMHCEGGHHLLSVIRYDPVHTPLTFMIDTYNGGSYFIGVEYPLVDAHFDLQNLQTPQEPSLVSDFNCHLYTCELTKAALHYLQNHDTVQLQEACNIGEYEQAKEILHAGMKQYLPYYEKSAAGWERKSRVEIEKYHRNLRWHLSGKIMMGELKKISQSQNQKTITA